MVHDLSVKKCSDSLPKDNAIVEFWDIFCVKRVGIYHFPNQFVELNTGQSFKAKDNVLCWHYK